MCRSFRILILPSLLTLAIFAVGLVWVNGYLTHDSRETTYLVASLRQADRCTLCHDGSFDRSSLKVATPRCPAGPPAN